MDGGWGRWGTDLDAGEVPQDGPLVVVGEDPRPGRGRKLWNPPTDQMHGVPLRGSGSNLVGGIGRGRGRMVGLETHFHVGMGPGR